MSDSDDRTTSAMPDPKVLAGMIKGAIDKVDTRVDELEARLQEVEAMVQRLSSNVAPIEPE